MTVDKILDCPHGGTGQLIIKEEDGTLFAKCLLADEVQNVNYNIFGKHRSTIAKNMGCPRALSEGGYRCCSYINGDFKELS